MGWLTQKQVGLEARFEPKADITAYEIALLLSKKWGKFPMSEEYLASFPEELRRHFRRLED